MSTSPPNSDFPKGLLRQELFLGVASSVSARSINVNLSTAGSPSGSHFDGSRYGRGEVGEFVLIEGQQSLLLGRIAEVRLHNAERKSIGPDFDGRENLDAIGIVQLLGSIAMDNLHVVAGVDAYPRLGDRVYAAPHRLLALLPKLMESATEKEASVTLSLGRTGTSQNSEVTIRPERLFGRHCAILGATGGGKSWTTARIIEQCIQHGATLILIDATGEYRGFTDTTVKHCHLGDPVSTAEGSEPVRIPPTGFIESDFIAMFEPAGKVQGPKLRAAIRSLRLAEIDPELATEGVIKKHNQDKGPIEEAEADPDIAARLDDPREAFDVSMLTQQIYQECVFPSGGYRNNPDFSVWGDHDEGSFSYCLSMITRVNAIIASEAFSCVFKEDEGGDLTGSIEAFLNDRERRLLRICLSGVSYEYNAREVIANVIGRNILQQARAGRFRAQPLVVLVDEAHNFLGRRFGTEDHATKLDAFELIAKEGRKYGLTLCLASQRPRDITEGVLSQMGTMIVHRLTNDRDREVVERACGEMDRSASSFLPNLRPGQATIIGTDFPIPLTVQVNKPVTKPLSDGPNYQEHWDIGG